MPRVEVCPLRVEVVEPERDGVETLLEVRVDCWVAVEVPRLLWVRLLPLVWLWLDEVLLPVREVADELRELPLSLVAVPLLEAEPLSLSLRLVEGVLPREVPLSLREVLLPVRVVLPSEREAELLSRVDTLLSRVPRPLSDSVCPGALEVVRLPVTRSVVVMVLLLRSLVMRLPLRPTGLFCTATAERGAVTRPTRGRLSYW